MVTVIDSGIANIGSVLSACRRIGVAAAVTTNAREVVVAQALILPGVGAFANGIESLRRHDLVEPIRDAAAAGTPILGICLGMQLLADKSEEFGEHDGLGLISGRVLKLPASAGERIPNIGWCDVTTAKRATLFEGVESGSAFYFVHSYYLECDDPADSAAGIRFGNRQICIAVERGNIFGAQFHPEKSQEPGLRFLANFVRAIENRSGSERCAS
jgi:imidazole glycerol-phosphate synthase subunit HisH